MLGPTLIYANRGGDVGKFYVESAASGKMFQAGIGGLLRNNKVKVLFMFQKHVELWILMKLRY